MRVSRLVFALGVASALAAACGGDDSNSQFNGSASDDGGVSDVDGSSFSLDGGKNDGGSTIACDEACPNGLVCDHGFCVPPQPQCFTNANCNFDTYCDSHGQCVPYGSKPDNKTNDPTCKLTIPAGALAPKTKCEFKSPPANDPFPNHIDVQATPAVVRVHGASAAPSIIAPFTAPVSGGYTETLGVVRVLKGTDCSLEANLGGVDLDGDTKVDWVRSSSPVAVGDLDGDGVAEIVMYMADDTTVAFTLKAGAWKPLWPKVKATLADGVTIFVSTISGGWSGPSIHDLDDDGKPEIVREGYVIDGASGKLRAQLPPSYASYSVGIPAVLAKLKSTGVQLTNGAHLWTFDGANNAWTLDQGYEAHTSPAGWAGVADFNPYDGLKQSEIAVASGGHVALYALDHSVFMGLDVAIPGGGGGPPTIADYDGDGLPEIGLAGADYYTVFDPDCQATPRTGGKCADRTHCDSFASGACPDMILWSKKTQDHSSNITGSSVFDFEADGVAEVVYADECFARVYSGVDGHVIFSQYHSSCTWLENPVVADVDGDFRAELVVPSNTACGTPGIGIACTNSLDANGVDAQFAGLICKTNADCFSGVCDNGLCRCTAGAQCCAANNDAACLEEGYKCVPPPAGTPGTGNTCRAARPHGVQGIRVYKDAKDRWVRSRMIWNQHAYAVTHVNEDGTIPKTSAWVDNWTTTGLDNFRQNVPGSADGKAIGDLTAQVGPFFSCSSGAAVLDVPVCNRGTAPVGAGIPIGFYTGSTKICSATTPSPIDIGKCVDVTCTWSMPPTAAAQSVDVTVVANDGNTTQECDTQNDKGQVDEVFCPPVK
jgi:hypothetical protein